jgi:hypothetical protein
MSVIAGVMIVWATIQSRIARGPARAPSGTSYLIQGLDPGRIASIIVGTGENTARLVRQGDRFVVGNKDNYPTVISKINDLITSCLDIRTAGLITSNPANHDDLEVSEEKARNIVKFIDNSGQTITGVVIGRTDSERRSTYVRLTSSNDVYTTTEATQAPDSEMDYVEKEIVNISRDDIVRVTVTGPNDIYTLKIDDGNDDDIILEGVPEGKKLKQSDAKQVLSALSYLSFADVKRESSQDGKLRFEHAFVCESKDEILYIFDVARTDDEGYVKCKAEYIGEAEIVIERGKKTKEELKDKEAKFLARDKAVSYSKRHQGWVYEIPEYKAKDLTRELAELLEEEKDEETANSASASNSEDTKGKLPK